METTTLYLVSEKLSVASVQFLVCSPFLFLLWPLQKTSTPISKESRFEDILKTNAEVEDTENSIATSQNS